jgi:hypothetical protein
MAEVLTSEDRQRCVSITSAAFGAVSAIARAVSDETGITLGEIMGYGRKRPVAEARQLVMFIAHRRGLSLAAIARHMRRDRSTVRHGVDAEYRRRAVIATNEPDWRPDRRPGADPGPYADESLTC